jgi:hypothetical protein
MACGRMEAAGHFLLFQSIFASLVDITRALKVAFLKEKVT